jgi:HEAT repeats
MDLEDKNIAEEAKSVRSLIQSFLQTLKVYQIYETNHPFLLKFLDNLKREFDRCFNKLDPLFLQVGQHQLLYREKVVYENQDAKEDLAFTFFRDGIREIRFFKGLESEEIFDFFDIVKKNYTVSRMQDDFVTLLWEKDFFHIEFIIVDEFLEEGSANIPVTDEDFLKRLEYRGFEEGSFKEEPVKAEPEQPRIIVEEPLYQPLNFDGMEEIFKRADQEQQPEYLYVLINNLIEILLHLNGNMTAYENMVTYFERVIKTLLEQEEVGKVVEILKNLQDTKASMPLKEKQTSAIDRILEIPYLSPSVEILGNVMRGNEKAASESILQYLHFMTKKAVSPLCNLLRELESERWRHVVCERLAELCKDEIEPLTKFLSDPNPFLVCPILLILGWIEHPSTLKYLRNLINHEDPKVRGETLKLISKFEEKGKDLVQEFLRDSMAEIRGKASRILAKIAREQAIKPLMEIILSKDFYRRDYEEKASFFRALAETGSEEAIQILKKVSKKRRWYERGKWDEMRECAAHTLRMIGADIG